jgi:hypothetical protein
MTSTQEPGEGQDVLPEFVEIAEEQTEGFTFDEDSQRLIAQLLVRGSQEMLRLPEGPDREEAVAAAAERLKVAIQSAAVQLREAELVDVDSDTLTVVMEGLCPVPPFCTGMGGPDEGGGGYAGYDDSAYANAEPAYAEA